MDLEKIVQERYATKLFDGRKIPEGKISKLFEVIRNAASSFNIQPWKIIVVKNQELKERLQPATWNQQQIPTCSQRQTFLALGNALNGAKSLGFDSCPMEGFDPKEYTKILGLPGNLVPTALCPIGYASDKPK